MDEREHERPQEVGVPLHALAHIPDEAVAVRQISRIPHGDHDVIVEPKVPSAINLEARSIGVEDEEVTQQRNADGQAEGEE